MASIWGIDHDNKMDEFDRIVEEIEKKHQHVFQNEINRLTGEKPDKLTNHFIPTWDSFHYGIGFLKDSYVPKYIQEEVTRAFVSVFSNK